jgi:hypothetical protein
MVQPGRYLKVVHDTKALGDAHKMGVIPVLQPIRARRIRHRAKFNLRAGRIVEQPAGKSQPCNRRYTAPR